MGTSNQPSAERPRSAFLRKHERAAAAMALAAYALPPYRPDAETGGDMVLCMTAATPLTIDQFKRIFRQKREIPNLVMLMTGIAYLILFTWMIAYSADNTVALTGGLL